MYLVQRRHKAVMIFWLSSQAANIYGFMALLKAFSGASLFILPALLYTKYCARRSPVCVMPPPPPPEQGKQISTQEIASMDFTSKCTSSSTFSNTKGDAHKKFYWLQGRMEIPLCCEWLLPQLPLTQDYATRKTAGEVVNFRIFSKHSGINSKLQSQSFFNIKIVGILLWQRS